MWAGGLTSKGTAGEGVCGTRTPGLGFDETVCTGVTAGPSPQFTHASVFCRPHGHLPRWAGQLILGSCRIILAALTDLVVHCATRGCSVTRSELGLFVPSTGSRASTCEETACSAGGASRASSAGGAFRVTCTSATVVNTLLCLLLVGDTSRVKLLSCVGL